MSALTVPTWHAVSWITSSSYIGSAQVSRVLLGVTGSVAAIRTPVLYAELKRAGHEVKIVATQAALYFFDPARIDPTDPARPQRNPAIVTIDEDEWPGRFTGQ